MPNLNKIFRLEVITDQLLYLIASGFDLSIFDLISFRISNYISKVSKQILYIVSFIVTVDNRIKDLIEPT
jgi:hypothetical protein